MDPVRFDRIVQSLASPSRRRLVSVALASASAVLLGAGADEGRAKKGKKRKKKCKACAPGQRCIKGKCTPQADGDTCGADRERLADGSCAQKCPEPSCASGCNCDFLLRYCIEDDISCETAQTCNDTTPCPRGQLCAITGCDPSFRCVALC